MKPEPNREALKKWIVTYKQVTPGYDTSFTIEAQSPEELCQFVTQIFPGRGDFTFSEVTIQ